MRARRGVTHESRHTRPSWSRLEIWAAKKRYPYIALSTAIDATKKIWELHDKVAQESGYEGGPEYRGYLQRCHVAETEEKALENARQFMWMQRPRG